MAAVASRKASAKVTAENKALPVLKRLEMMCLFCGHRECNGEGCIPYGECLKCGGPHSSKLCTINLSSVMEKRGCYYCLDLYSRRDYKKHKSKKECPLQRRLRRLFIDAWQNDRSQVDYVRFVTKFLCSKEQFYGFVANYSRSK